MGSFTNSLKRQRLILMVKEPCAGRVKTRLARNIGMAAALNFYRTATANLIRRLWRDPRWQLVLAVSPDTALHSRAWPANIPRIAQGHGDLGMRMDRLLHEREYHASIIIGSDIPAIRPAHIAGAFHLLAGHDFVFGPAADGGYWLIGMRPCRPAPGLFSNVRWSSPYTLKDTLRNLAGRTILFAPQLNDVDDAVSYSENAHLGLCVTPFR